MVSWLTAQDSIPVKIDINNVEVIKSFEATLEDAKIQDIKATIPVQKPFKPTYKYDITIVPLDLTYPEPAIKPLAMNPDGDFIVNKGYVRAAYQHLINPSLKGGYYHMVKDEYDLGIHVDMEAIDNSKKVAYQKYNYASIDLFGSKQIKDNIKLGLLVNTNLNSRYMYHIDLNVDSLYSEEDSKRKYYLTTIGSSISNPEATKYGINYHVDLNFQDATTRNQNMTESTVALRSRFDKVVKQDHLLGLDVDGSFHSLSNDQKNTLGVFKTRPYFKFNKGKLGLLVGASTVVSSNKKNVAIFPDIRASWNVWDGRLTAFGELHQDNYTNNIFQVLSINGYLSNNIDSLVNSISKEFGAGIKGAFGFLEYEGSVYYKAIKDQMLFLNNKQDIRFFDMVYDDLDVVSINSKVHIFINDHLKLGGWLNQNIYDSEKQSKVWHIPNTEINTFAQWSLLDDELLIRSDLYFGTKVDFIDKFGIERKSNILLDLNLRSEYKILENFTIFITGNNLLNNKFERYYGYPSIGTNIGGGLQWIF
jgi:hypothetical protein